MGSPCGNNCWLPQYHAKAMDGEHCCRSCWASFPIEIRCIRDENGLPAFNEARRKIEEQKAVMAPRDTADKECWKERAGGYDVSDIRAWAWPFQTNGKERKVAHIAIAGKGCACHVKLPQRRIKSVAMVKDLPIDKRICSHCFSELSGRAWRTVIDEAPHAIPTSMRKLLGMDAAP